MVHEWLGTSRLWAVLENLGGTAGIAGIKKAAPIKLDLSVRCLVFKRVIDQFPESGCDATAL
jgi:hypothetical protein